MAPLNTVCASLVHEQGHRGREIFSLAQISIEQDAHCICQVQNKKKRYGSLNCLERRKHISFVVFAFFKKINAPLF